MKVTFFLFIVGCLQAAEYSFSLPWKFVWFIGRFKSQDWRMLCSGWRVWCWSKKSEMCLPGLIQQSSADSSVKMYCAVPQLTQKSRKLQKWCPLMDVRGKDCYCQIAFLVGSPPKMETLFLSRPWHQSVCFCEYIFSHQFFVCFYI